MQYVITAYDGNDDEAQLRRQHARAAHLAGAQTMRNKGELIAGGAILDDDDQMIGSTLYVEFDSRAALEQWLRNDPYVTGGVWKDISVQPIKLAVRA